MHLAGQWWVWVGMPELTNVMPRRPLPQAPAGLAAANRWAVTVAATAASTWALDAVAAATGVLLAASHALDGASRGVVLGFLAATYLVWGAGLRVNLMSNWRLLEETGTSTNALSKAMFDLTRLR
ncbi:MAG TPA: hypothetical protein VNO51_04555, partial [Ilumatobacteraceae bacterium]|nr:hypothetical protein [Ilumatobacteraceae bacterium]